MPRMTNWITSVSKYVSRQHLEGAGAAAIIMFGCMYIKNRWQMAASTGVTCNGSQMIGILRGRKLAVQRILDAKWIQTNPSAIKDARQQLKEVLDEDEKNMHVEVLRHAVAILEMGGKEDCALELLLDAAKKNGEQHKKYEIEMCIVEVLIYKGDYDKALKQQCLKEKEITDSRRPLYEALIHVMKGREAEARKCWEELLEIQDHLQSDSFHGAEIHNLLVEFRAFKDASQLLKNEIEARKKPKTSSNAVPIF